MKGTITYCVAFLVMILLPVYHWYLTPFIILWVVFWLYENRRIALRNLRAIPFKYRVLFLLFILFYLWQVTGMLYSDNSEAGWRNIVLRLPLFLFPLVLISPGESTRMKTNTLLKVFALGTCFFLTICLGYALYRSLSFNNGIWSYNPHPKIDNWLNFFYGSEFAIFQHPSYLSMFALFSLFISAESFFKRSLRLLKRILWSLVCVWLLISIFLLSSRAEILAVLTAIPVYILYKYRLKSLKKIISFIVLILLVCVFILIPVLKSNPRFSSYLNEVSGKELSDKLLKESRLAIWKSSFNIIRKNFVFGVGTGDIQDELNKEYKRTGDKDLAIENNLNAHNQFLEVLLENGLIGILLFLSVLGMMLYISLREANILYLIFIIVIFISFLFETMLNRLAGVSFFALFSFLLLHTKPPDPSLFPDTG